MSILLAFFILTAITPAKLLPPYTKTTIMGPKLFLKSLPSLIHLSLHTSTTYIKGNLIIKPIQIKCLLCYQALLKVPNACLHATSKLGTKQIIIYKLAKYVLCQIMVTAVEFKKKNKSTEQGVGSGVYYNLKEGDYRRPSR